MKDVLWEKPGPSSEPGKIVPAKNTNAGNYRPASLGISKNDLIKGLKGIKVKQPNKYLTTTAYKSGLKKVAPESEE